MKKRWIVAVAVALGLAGVLGQQVSLPKPEGPRVEVVASTINAKVKVPGCTRDANGQVVCAVTFESQAQTNQSVVVLHSSVRAVAPDGFSYPGYLVVEGGTTDGTKTTFSLPAGGRANGRLVFPGVPQEVGVFPLVQLGGLEFRGLPVAGAAPAQAEPSGQAKQSAASAASAPLTRPTGNTWEAWEGRISLGIWHALYVAKDGTVWAWGRNQDGELGIGKKTEVELKPVRVQGLTDVVAVSAGRGHSLALKRDGTVWAWGNANFGQVGPSPNPLLPYQIPNLKDVVAIAAAAESSFALTRDGSVWSWGRGRWGLLGTGDFSDRIVPTRIKGLENVRKISISWDVIASAITSDGSLYVWGLPVYNQLGQDRDCPGWPRSEREGQATPIKVPDLPPVEEVAAGGHHVLVITKGGEVWGWGHSRQGQVGTWSECQRKVRLSEIPGVPFKVLAGHNYSGVVTKDGALWMWGANRDWEDRVLIGYLGIGPVNNNFTSPVPPIGMDRGVIYVTSFAGTLVIKDDGTVWVWGRNEFGQLGVGNRDHQAVPVQIKLPDMP
ncbi:RCC1 domain-containing protein [Thermus tengchongensis]|uniref:RCC1-like domain-containing protein n=1 Tax=Thermus tengchongensis TaxID=1214928 RepID=A0A4Y9FF39_9DEIN|nr:RCC1 domain-containing protein [Thermus tengchongensis]TFU27502.1 hypothetical protein E0687_01845 [Thermus tengchongensis]